MASMPEGYPLDEIKHQIAHAFPDAEIEVTGGDPFDVAVAVVVRWPDGEAHGVTKNKSDWVLHPIRRTLFSLQAIDRFKDFRAGNYSDGYLDEFPEF